MLEINNLTTNPISDDFLKKIAKIVLEGEGLKEGNVSLALVGQGRMRQINKRYRKKNRVTDVLAFPESKILLEKFKIGAVQKISGLGEIIICPREVMKNVKRYKSSFEKELTRVLIHGILHLLGYDHELNKQGASKMEKKQTYYLSLLE